MISASEPLFQISRAGDITFAQTTKKLIWDGTLELTKDSDYVLRVQDSGGDLSDIVAYNIYAESAFFPLVNNGANLGSATGKFGNAHITNLYIYGTVFTDLYTSHLFARIDGMENIGDGTHRYHDLYLANDAYIEGEVQVDTINEKTADAGVTMPTAGDITMLDDKFIDLGNDTAGAAANAANRGKLRFVEGAGGARDRVYSCMKSDADAYSWVEIANGGA